MGVTLFKQANSGLGIMPIDECPREELKNAKEVARQQYIQDLKFFGKHILGTGKFGNKDEKQVIIALDIEEWQNLIKGYPIYTELGGKNVSL